MKDFKFELGQKAKDKITGFEGIIIGRADHLTGCNTYGLKPKVDKDGKVVSAEWFDEGTLTIVGKGITIEEVKAPKRGGSLSENPPG